MKLILKETIAKVVQTLATIINKPAYTTHVLYNGTKAQGNIALNGNPADYDFLQITTRTNVEYFTDVVYVGADTFMGQNITIDHQEGTGSYRSALACAYANNIMYAGVTYNNVNWQLGVIKVVGIKLGGVVHNILKALQSLSFKGVMA